MMVMLAIVVLGKRLDREAFVVLSVDRATQAPLLILRLERCLLMPSCQLRMMVLLECSSFAIYDRINSKYRWMREKRMKRRNQIFFFQELPDQRVPLRPHILLTYHCWG